MNVTGAVVGLESFEYHGDSDTYRARFDRSETVPSSAVVASVSEVLDVDVLDMDPLYDSIDPDALVRHRSDTNGDIAVHFTVEGHEVSVYSYGVVAVSSSRSAGSDSSIDQVSSRDGGRDRSRD